MQISFQSTISFPPYTGGCIEGQRHKRRIKIVSSLYGRVYRRIAPDRMYFSGFLPIREGVSRWSLVTASFQRFPPYTGGCIVTGKADKVISEVSSLYGRVYRQLEKNAAEYGLFPPYTGGCIVYTCSLHKYVTVSSLYGRVYLTATNSCHNLHHFLPIWEGVSRFVGLW